MRAKSTFIILLLILASLSLQAQNTFVVSIGIADYKEINDLRYTEQDVVTFNEIMLAHKAVITTLTGADASHAAILKTIRTVFAQAKPEDAVILFFSGHGYEGGFCCYDMKGNSNLGGLSYQEMQILFRNCRAGRKMIFADACFSGGLAKQRTQLQVQAVSNNEVMFFLSSQLDETSLELPNGPNGLFTYYLAKGLCGEADLNMNKVIDASEIFSYVRENVSNWAAQIPHNQHPTIWGNYDKSMPIIDWLNY